MGTPCWYVKDYADGWIKFYDVQAAIQEAMHTGAIMFYAFNGEIPTDLKVKQEK